MRINGLKVVDLTKPLKIHVTALDAKRGDNKNPSSCAAARACLRDVPGCTQARVHIGRTYLKVDNKWLRALTPRQLRTEIISFDRGAAFQPGVFTLSPIPPSGRLGKHGAGTETGRNKRVKIARPHRVIEGVRQHGANR